MHIQNHTAQQKQGSRQIRAAGENHRPASRAGIDSILQGRGIFGRSIPRRPIAEHVACGSSAGISWMHEESAKTETQKASQGQDESTGKNDMAGGTKCSLSFVHKRFFPSLMENLE